MSGPAQTTISSLDARARDIFRSVVQSYLETGQPVGSRTLALSGTQLSPASIRGVMAELTAMGLLESPHVSAGRRPTQAGLRLFVDGLLQVGDVGADERRALEAQIAAAKDDPEEIFAQTSAMLGGLAGGAGLLLLPEAQKDEPLRHVEFVPLDDGSALVVMVTESGRVENRFMKRPKGVVADALDRAGLFLSARLKGRRLSEARAAILDEIETGHARIDAAAAALIRQGLADWSPGGRSERRLIIRGQARLLDNLTPGSNLSATQRAGLDADLERIQLLFEDLERKEDLIALLDRTEHADGVKIFIGTENPLFSLSESSVVVAPYRDHQGQVLGALGVIGPTRLNYGRVIPIVDLTAQLVGETLARRG